MIITPVSSDVKIKQEKIIYVNKTENLSENQQFMKRF